MADRKGPVKTSERLRAAIYARVSSKQQAEARTIASQVEALKARVLADGARLEAELCFVDEGYSGGTLLRPALERLRDQAAAGGFDRLYVHSPDRLSRSYAYQVLLVEELQRQGVEIVFLNHDIGRTPEENLLLQVQGMMAEYERAKILERSRRGKRHAAKAGAVNVLGGAPYGYRYVGKYEGGGQARYEVVEAQAEVVRQIFSWVALNRCSIGEVCRRLQEREIPSPRGKSYWDRTTVWGILKNPAYVGQARFGKTRVGPQRPRLRSQRGRPSQPRKDSSVYDTPVEDQIAIPVPAIVDEAVFAAVAGQLAENRFRLRERRRGGRYLLQGLLVCEKCGYAYYGKPLSASSRKGKSREYAYYRCVGTDAYRFGGQRVCGNRQCRTDLIDQEVWRDVCALLSDPERVRREYEGRLRGASKKAGRPSEQLARLIGGVRRGITRLIDAYQEGFLERDEFEPRIRAAKERLAKLEAEAKAAADREVEAGAVSATINQLQAFAARVRDGLKDADWGTRREILRALIRKVEVGDEAIRIEYKVGPLPFDRGPGGAVSQDCGRCEWPALRCPFLPRDAHAVLHQPRFQEAADDPQQAYVADSPGQSRHQDVVVHPVKELFQVHVHHDDPPVGHVLLGLSQGIVCPSAGPEAEARRREGRVQPRFEHVKDRLLHQPVHDRRDAQLPHPAAGLGDLHPAHRLRSIRPVEQRCDEFLLVRGEPGTQFGDGHPIDSRRPLVRLDPAVRLVQVLRSAHLLHQTVGQGSCWV
jgi:site-specific DNA recombinase